MKLRNMGTTSPKTLIEALEQQKKKQGKLCIDLKKVVEEKKDVGVLLRGVDEAVEILLNILKDNKSTLIYTDPDVDGFISTYFLATVLKEQGVNYVTYVNKNREHGFLLPIESVAGKYNVVNGDFTITPEQLQQLVDGGSNVLSMDHHDVPDSDELITAVCEEKKTKGVYINNQYSFENRENDYLSGAQVVLYTLREVLKKLGAVDSKIFTKEYTALAAITLLSDIRDINNDKARLELSILYNLPIKGNMYRMYKELTKGKKDYGYGIPQYDRAFIDYTFTPAINSLIRMGREEEALNFILGAPYPEDKETPQKQQKRFVDRVLEKSTTRDYGNLRIVKIDGKDFNYEDRLILSNFLGLVCSRLQEGGKGVLGFVIGLDGEVERASFRGNKVGIPYRTELSKVIDARGHEIAFGVKNFQPNEKVLKEVVTIVNNLEKNAEEVLNVIKLDEDGFKDLELIKNTAIENGYRTQETFQYIQFTGTLVTLLYDGPTVKKWNINGVEVLQFDMSLDIRKDLILPSTNRKEVVLILNRKAN